MTPGRWRAIGFCLVLSALAACGLKGDPRPPEPDAARADG